MSEKFICIHGHFYQPPRENPWLEEVEIEESARPYHDWNAKITAECYAPNSSSRIMDMEEKIIGLLNNYSKISFDFGPTLLYWISRREPELYQSILESDKESARLCSGHGSAMAQAYNHIIMPLANDRDKETQIKWGIEDFEARFERYPEGMWLPETAVDTKTLEILANNGIKFTVLAPHQAKRSRKFDDSDWIDNGNGSIDTKQVYKCNLPSGKNINIFFFNKTSTEAAFGEMLSNGETFANKLLSLFDENESDKCLVNIATDGELYGHHRFHGDMTLAYCLYYLTSRNLAKITNYGEYLEKNAPKFEVEIKEDTSWSCLHGIERWRSDCGDNSGKHQDWNQGWRKPLRNAMDWLRDVLAPSYEHETEKYLKDPWSARNDYIEVVLDRSKEKIYDFISKHASRDLNQEEKVKVMSLMEMQRHAMLMFTSCGWFFDDISGIETVQIIKYAARTLQLAKDALGLELENQFVKMLEQAQSNVQEHKNGAKIYDKFVKPAMMNSAQISAQGVIISTFSPADNVNVSLATPSDCFELIPDNLERLEQGKFRLSIGQLRFASNITLENEVFGCAAVWLGDHNVSCGVKKSMPEEELEIMRREVLQSFEKGQINETILQIAKHFKEVYSLKNMFKDEQQHLLNIVIEGSIRKAHQLYEIIYRDQSALLRFMKEIGIPPPRTFQAAAEIVFNQGLVRAFSSKETKPKHLKHIIENAKHVDVEIDCDLISLKAGEKITKELEQLREDPENKNKIDEVRELINSSNQLSLSPNWWKAQNIAFKIAQNVFEDIKERKDEKSRKLYSSYGKLCELLGIKLN
jgi:alpha-amylase/alpha-mannosidase (GH57 family)